MANQTKWKSRAVKFFDSARDRVYTRKSLAAVLITHGPEIGTPRTLTVQKFITALEEFGELRATEISPVNKRKAQETRASRREITPATVEIGPYKSFVRYVWGQVSAYEVALSLRPRSYLSHASAVFLHGLTTQIPRTIYVNKEQSEKPASDSVLTQQGIDRAFANKSRSSNYVFAFEGTHIVLLNGKNTGNLEVSELQDATGRSLAVTKLERTLIDITVRPNYAGGIYEVLRAFQGAKDRTSVATLVATLNKLKYSYPYHQAIGFYMQRAEYSDQQLQRLRALPSEFRFYLTNQMPEPILDEEWKVYYPKGL